MFDFNNPIKMCSRRSCCPTIEFGEDHTSIIKDDFDGEVILSIDELNIMVDIINQYNIKCKSLGIKNEK